MFMDLYINSAYAYRSPSKKMTLTDYKEKQFTGVNIPKTKGRKYYQAMTSLPPYRLLEGDHVELPNGEFGSISAIWKRERNIEYIVETDIGYFNHRLEELTLLYRGFILNIHDKKFPFQCDHNVTDYGISPEPFVRPVKLTNSLLTNEEFKKTYLSGDRRYINEYYFREWFTTNVSWPIITKDLVDILAEQLKGKKVADLGCGLGYLTYHLKAFGVDIVGFDNKSDAASYEAWGRTVKTGEYIDYKESDIDTLDLSGFDVVILSWPRTAHEVLNNLKSGQEVIYIGEGKYGCTGSKNFHELLEGQFSKQETEYPLLRWSGIYDHCEHYIKK